MYQGGNSGFGLGNTAYAGGGTQHAQSQDPYLEGTVPRPGPGSLEEVWHDGEEDASRTENEISGGRNTLHPGYHPAPPQAVPTAVQGV